MSKTRNFAFTAHINEHIDGELLLNALRSVDSLAFTQFQLERAPTAGTLHFQGMAVFRHPITFSRLQRIITNVTGVHPHTEVINNMRRMIAYTSKEESRVEGPWRWGEVPLHGRELPNPGFGPGPEGPQGGGQGARNDVAAFRDAIIAGKSDSELVMEHPSLYMRYPGMPMRIRALFAPKRDWAPEVHVFFGAAGTGKSRRAHEMAPDAYRKVSGPWWDGYEGQPDVIMDDFYGTGHLDYTEWLKLTDRYDYRAPVKGSTVRLNPRRIFMTSNSHPEQWYCTEKHFNSSAFFRRFTSIIRFNQDGTTTDLSEIVLE